MLLEPALEAIQLDVADLKFNESTFKQQARPCELLLRFLPSGDVELLLTMNRTAFGLAADGSAADVVPASYLKLEPARLLANRDVAVSPADGFPRYRLRTPTTVGPDGTAHPGSAYNTLTQQVEQFGPGQDWNAFLNAKPEAYMLQDRYFGVMCTHENINIFDLLLAYARQADAAPSVFAVQ